MNYLNELQISDEVINTIEHFKSINESGINTLIEKFGLEWHGKCVHDQVITTEQLINLKPKKMKTEKNNKFKTEVTEQLNKFLKFETLNEPIEGFIVGHKILKDSNGKESKHFLIKIDNDIFLLPSNYQIVSKLNNLESIRGSFEIEPAEVQITYIGEKKIENSINKVKEFRVLTA